MTGADLFAKAERHAKERAFWLERADDGPIPRRRCLRYAREHENAIITIAHHLETLLTRGLIEHPRGSVETLARSNFSESTK